MMVKCRMIDDKNYALLKENTLYSLADFAIPTRIFITLELKPIR